MDDSGAGSVAPAVAKSVHVRRPRPPLLVAARLGTAVSLGGVLVNGVLQLMYPPVLLRHWGDAGFGFVVAVQGFASYVSVADAGVQVYFVQRIASLRAAGDHDAADALTASCLRLLSGLALLGFVTVSAAFAATGHAVWSGLARRDGETDALGLAAAFAQIAACALALALGGWCTAVDSGHSRYARAHAFGFAKGFLTTAGLMAFALTGIRSASALIGISAVSIGLDVGRFALTWRGEVSAATSPTAVPDLIKLLYQARGSALWYVATSTQNGLQPYVATVISAAAVSVAVPGRSLANSCRSLSQAVGTAVWVAVAARFAELPDGKARYAFWARNSPVMSVIQLISVAGLMVVAPVFVPHWIPSKGAAVMNVLPWCLAEQAVYVAVIPSQYLLFATGSFGRIGVATLAAALASVAVTWVAEPHYGSVGFVAANTTSVLFIMAPAMAAFEWAHWRSQGVRVPAAVAGRYGVALVTVALCALYARFAWLAFAGVVLFACLMGAYYLRHRPRGWRPF